MSAGKCRVCGCVDHDCSGCVERTGEPCHWVKPDLCSACTGEALIRIERVRHVFELGWTAEHDDGHTEGELRKAAECYAEPPAIRQMHREVLQGCCAEGQRVRVPKAWPWEAMWWRPSRNRARELVKAGALYQAEADRQERLGHKCTAERMRARSRGCAREIDLLARTPKGLRWMRKLVAVGSMGETKA